MALNMTTNHLTKLTSNNENGGCGQLGQIKFIFVPDSMLAINILPSSWNELAVLEKIGIGKKDKNNTETSIAINATNQRKTSSHSSY